MESSRSNPPARRTTEPAVPEGERRDRDRALKEQTDKEIAERVSSPPEPPTPTQAEADAYKEGTAQTEPPADETEAQRTERETRERQQREQRDVKPGEARSGYQTR